MNDNCYELTATKDYVEDWSFSNAIRELIQNGIDAEQIDPYNKFSIEYQEEDEKLLLRNEKSKLKVSSLLFGKSNKLNNDDTVGHFGEGYKVAAIILNRMGKTFTIYNNNANEIWTSKFKNSEKWKEQILAFYVNSNVSDDTGLIFEIGNVSLSEYEELYEVYLPMYEDQYSSIKEIIDTPYGEILVPCEEDDGVKGRIWVNGLAVNCYCDLEYGYNFKAKYIPLERDRKTAESWDVKRITSKMMLNALKNGRITLQQTTTLIRESSDDLSLLDYCGENIESLKKDLENEFIGENIIHKENAVPVSSEKEKKEVLKYGGEPVIVNSNMANLLSDYRNRKINELAESYTEDDEIPVKMQFQNWYDLYSGELGERAKKTLSNLINKIIN